MADPMFEREVTESLGHMGRSIRSLKPGPDMAAFAHWKLAQYSHSLSVRGGCPEPIRQQFEAIRDLALLRTQTPLVGFAPDLWARTREDFFGIQVVMEALLRMVLRVGQPTPALVSQVRQAIRDLEQAGS